MPLNTTMPWFLYLLKCSDGTFYAGITNDLEKRLLAHNEGKGAKYTRGRAPLELLASKACESRSSALKEEAAVKKLPKNQKIKFFNAKIID
ncbi:MAG: GIY-YIG nuclease family protein [Betaproteobacteria bacterium]